MNTESHIIIGTAGHIDHGKTTLVHALTGSFLDSTPEEKQRGITIHLGFTHRKYNNQTLSFIDVPGHENFIQTMIAGTSGIDTVVLCVSAVDSVMPQTIEHLQILQFLGVQSGVIAITHADQADEEMIEFVSEDIATTTKGTFLERAPIFTFQNLHSYTEGENRETSDNIQSLLLHLSQTQILPRDSKKAPFRLYIDRAFSIKGHGTVVTGTISSGSIQVGETITIGSESTTKVRNIEVHGSVVESAFAGQRVALNISNISVQQLSRGAFLQRQNSIPQTQMIDILYHYVDKPLQSGMSVRFLSASFDVIGKIYLYENIDIEPPKSFDSDGIHSPQIQYLQIRTQKPIYVLSKDRYIIREVSPQKMLGGGYILDPYPPKCQNKTRSKQLQYLKKLSFLLQKDSKISQELSVLYINRHSQFGIDKKKGDLLFGNRRDEKETCQIQCIDQKYYTEESLSFYINPLKQIIETYHKSNPLRHGVVSSELHSLALSYISKDLFSQIIKLGIDREIWQRKKTLIFIAGFRVLLTSTDQIEIDKLAQTIFAKNLEGIKKQGFSSNKYLDYLIQEDMIIIVDKQLIHKHVLLDCIEKLQMHFIQNPQLETSEFKELTGLSRKFAIPLLEWLDQQLFTKRQENYRIKGDALFNHSLLTKIG